MRLVLALTAALGVAACSSPDDASGDFHLELVQAPTTATPGSVAPQSVLVRVVNGDGTSIPGVPVTWSIRSGGGHLTPSADTSGVDGLAAAQWTPGLAAGSQQIGVTIYDQLALTVTVEAEVFRADKITTAYRSGCGLRGRGVWCWEYAGTAASIERVLPELQARDIALSGSYLCVLQLSGSVYCQRAFGDPAIDSRGTVQGLPPLSALGTGGATGSFCGLAQADGTPWCWSRGSLTATQLFSTLSLTQISGDSFRGCGLTATAAAWCWGFGASSNPELLLGGQAFRLVSAGVVIGCAVKVPTDLYCWYAGDPAPRYFGITASQVAVGNSASMINGSLGATEFYFWSLDPVQYHLGSTFPLPVTQISSQDDTSCVIAYDAGVYCLGVNDNIEQVYKSTWEAIPAQP